MPTSKRSGLNPQAQEHSIDVLERTNKLISAVGLQAKPIAEVAELKQCATSMFVAIFEAMFRVRVRGIVRVPKYTKDYNFIFYYIDLWCCIIFIFLGYPGPCIGNRNSDTK